MQVLDSCLYCDNDMNKRNGKGVLVALKLFYEGSGVHEQVVCKCGIQTKKVLLDGTSTARDIWNRGQGVKINE